MNCIFFLLDSKITVDILWSFGMLSNTRLVDHCFLNISGVYTLVNIYILQKIENIVRHVLASNPPTVKWQVYNPRFNEYGNNTFNVYIFLHNKQTAQLKIIVAANISMLHRIPLEFEYWKKYRKYKRLCTNKNIQIYQLATKLTETIQKLYLSNRNTMEVFIF